MRRVSKMQGCILGQFSTLKFVSGSNFKKFKEFFKADFQKGFVVPADTFDNVKGKFPIGFMIWNSSKPENFKSIDSITAAQISETTNQFIGTIFQLPPQHSAIKKDGKRLYEHARAGEEVEIQARKTTIYEFEITRIQLPEVDFRVKCSKGTYIRSLAYDFGLALQSGGHLTALRRTKIGDYSVNNAISPIDFEKEINNEN